MDPFEESRGLIGAVFADPLDEDAKIRYEEFLARTWPDDYDLREQRARQSASRRYE